MRSSHKTNINELTMPIISIVMPAYNVEKYIGQAIESIIRQTFEDWELIVVDDCSKDNTLKVVEEWQHADTRIRCIKRKQNSGCVRIPRFDGVIEAEGELVCPIDSDDRVEPDYLSKMLARQRETQCDIVLGRMVFCNECMVPDGRMIPRKEYDMSQLFNKHEAVKRTLGEWKIAMNGMLVKADSYKAYVQSVYHSGLNVGYEDELDHRKLILTISKVALVDTAYYYRQQPNSVIHAISLKRFDELIIAKLVYELAMQAYPTDIEIHEKVRNEYFEKTYRCRLLYLQHKKQFKEEERRSIRKLIKEAFLNSYSKTYTGGNAKLRFLMSSWTMFLWLTIVIQKINKYFR